MNPSFLLILSLIFLPTHAIEPISTTAVAGAAVIGSFGWGVYENVKCQVLECCSNAWIPKNYSYIEKGIKQSLYGQHIAEDLVLSSLERHLSSEPPEKPLVLSFHGWTGVGKTYVAKLIADGLYTRGTASKFFHLIPASLYFLDPSRNLEYQNQLQEWISGNVSECGQVQMFVFDEVDKVPAGVLDALVPFLNAYSSLGGLDYRRNIFIFLSNTGGEAILQKLRTTFTDGRFREDLGLNDFAKEIESETFDSVDGDTHGGLYRSSIIVRGLIALHVPFLPLETSHIKLCIEKYLDQEKQPAEMKEQLAKVILKELDFYPDDLKLYSRTGCKRIPELYYYAKRLLKRLEAKERKSREKKMLGRGNG